MTLKTTAWNPAESLDSPEAELAYIEAAFEDGTTEVIAAAIGDVARARGMTQVARDAGLSRETMYRAFSYEGNPTLSTMLGVMRALGLELRACANLRSGRS